MRHPGARRATDDSAEQHDQNATPRPRDRAATTLARPSRRARRGRSRRDLGQIEPHIDRERVALRGVVDRVLGRRVRAVGHVGRQVRAQPITQTPCPGASATGIGVASIDRKVVPAPSLAVAAANEVTRPGSAAATTSPGGCVAHDDGSTAAGHVGRGNVEHPRRDTDSDGVPVIAVAVIAHPLIPDAMSPSALPRLTSHGPAVSTRSVHRRRSSVPDDRGRSVVGGDPQPFVVARVPGIKIVNDSAVLALSHAVEVELQHAGAGQVVRDVGASSNAAKVPPPVGEHDRGQPRDRARHQPAIHRIPRHPDRIAALCGRGSRPRIVKIGSADHQF